MSNLGTPELPLRVAIVGSGPSGFYAAEAVYKSGLHVEVDMFERLPCPYGLVRLGVAPDHDKIKSAIKVYEKIAARAGFRLWANVTIGRDLSVEELRAHFDAVIFAHGAETDRRLNIPGEDLPGSHTATEFVAWYNGHPDYCDRVFDLSHEDAVVIGQGNVAVDVCRILAKTTDELKRTDIAAYALDALAESAIRRIHMIGRRGPVQAKFTQLEVKELGRLAACDPVVQPRDMELDPLSAKEYDDPENKLARKIVPILDEFSKRPKSVKPRQLHFHFLKSPEAIEGRERVESIVLRHNRLTGEPSKLRAEATNETESLACGLVFRSVGYHGVALEGLPFDERAGIVPNDRGRVKDQGAVLNGIYVAGWIKRGPSGVIGTNKPDSAETVASLLADLPRISPAPNRTGESLERLLESRSVRVVTFPEWTRIDAAEIARGKAAGKPREKFTHIDEFLAVLDAHKLSV